MSDKEEAKAFLVILAPVLLLFGIPLVLILIFIFSFETVLIGASALAFSVVVVFAVVNSKREKRTKNESEARLKKQQAEFDQNDASEVKARESEPQEPQQAPEPPPIDGVLIGTDTETDTPLHILTPLRGRHLYLIGKTRTGKTTLIKNLIIQDMEAGYGLCVIDPHGDMAEELAGSVPQERLKDVIYFDPTSEYCPAFNFLSLPYPAFKLTEDVISVFKMFFGDSWGQRMEHLLRYSLMALLMNKNTYTLNDLKQLLTSENARADILNNVTNDGVLNFWNDEFPKMAKGAPDPIVNKLSAFLVPSSPMYRVFSNPRNDLNFTEIMDGKILIVNLAKGKVGDEPSKILGGMISSGIQQASLARADTPMEKRYPFHFYVDEFQNYVTPAFETILSESAKYKLFLTLAHQTLGQLPSSMEHAIFGNIATLISFQVSADDANRLKREMHRTNFTYFNKETREWRPLSEFVKEQIQTTELRIKEIGGAIEAFKEGATEYVLTNTDGMRKGEKERVSLHPIYIRDWTNTLRDFDRPNLERLRNLPNDIAGIKSALYTWSLDIQQKDFPNTHDFINLLPRTAFCRMERAENVYTFRTIKAPDPVAGIRGQVLHAMREQHSERSPQPVTSQPDTPQEATIQNSPIPKPSEAEQTAQQPQPVYSTHAVESESEPPATESPPDPFIQKEPPTRRKRRRQRQRKPKDDQLSF